MNNEEKFNNDKSADVCCLKNMNLQSLITTFPSLLNFSFVDVARKDSELFLLKAKTSKVKKTS